MIDNQSSIININTNIMIPLQKDPKQLRTIKELMVYKSDLKEKPGAAGEKNFRTFCPEKTSSHFSSGEKKFVLWAHGSTGPRA